MSAATVNIDTIEYVETIEEETVTPLGIKTTACHICDCVRVTITCGPVAGHWLYFKPEAIADRMHGYSLEEEEHAVEALVRELVFGWSPELLPADPASRVDVLGGADDRIAVTWSPGAEAAAAELLKGAHADRIAAFRAAIVAEPAPELELAEQLAPPADPPEAL